MKKIYTSYTINYTLPGHCKMHSSKTNCVCCAVLSIPGKQEKIYVKMLEHGQKLYRIHCSPCHGIFTKGKDSIPNFSKTQIEAYKSSALLDDPKNHAVAQKIRAEDLDMILQFLSFRKLPDGK